MGSFIYNIPLHYGWVPPSIIFLGIIDRARSQSIILAAIMDGSIIYNIPPDYGWVPPSIIFLGIMDRTPLTIHNSSGYYGWAPAACDP
jgi:hypothetical protein